MGKSLSCESCKRTYINVSSMNRHLRTFHPEKIEPVKISVVRNIMRCALCEHTTSKSQLIDHMQSLHNMKIEQETLKFDSLENFEIWKGNIERTTNASFVKHRGTYIGKKCNTTKFECHRSGIFKSRSKGEGHNKHHQSVKIDSYCPASIKLTQNGIKYEVEFIKTHVGHINTLAKLFRPKTVIQISMANILNEGRDKKGNDNLERLHSLTSKDLHKIQQ
ncbi:uncharacterized protein LOC143191761 isoform X2 [Rhynchophorus ferrugineus]|uniref:uncharacterized protein LOC143191761 isoform X2 n=1 Tax=Rhynchophorus ferrugineus TaxID=354439 RepID=UPI003FCD2366